jgi:hypothetical protein
MQSENIHTIFEDSLLVPLVTLKFNVSLMEQENSQDQPVVNFILSYYPMSRALLIQQITFRGDHSFSSITDHPLYQTGRLLHMSGNSLAWVEYFQRMANPEETFIAVPQMFKSI